ncbi:MAG TPA: PDZ domain-containing protein [Chitinophagaceae bacterium]
MKQVCQKVFTLFFAVALMMPASLLAQKEEKEKEKESKDKKEAEQIIITRKGDKNEKVVVEINGDKITVNGKPIEDLKDGDVSVRRNKIRDMWAYADGLNAKAFAPGETFKMYNMDSNRAMLGVTTEKADQGVEVQEITKESAAAKAGLKEGDIITKIGDKKIENPDELSAAIKAQKPGDKVTVTYLRDKKEQKATAELGKWKGANVFTGIPGHDFKMDMGDMHLDEIMPRLQTMPRAKINGQTWNWSEGGNPKLGLSVQDTDDGKGVKVIEVDEESNAAKAGLKENDVISEVDGKAVNSADEVAKIIRESKDKVSVMVKLQRSGKTQNVEVKIPRKLKTADL